MEREAMETALKALREPFPQEAIGLLPKPYKKDSPKGQCKDCGGYHALPAVHLKYVGHAALTDRLLKVDPLWNWEPLSLSESGLPLFDDNGGVWIKLTILGVTRLGYGDSDGKKGPNAVKEAIGDALRNAAMRFGCALDLWHKGGMLYDLDASDFDSGQGRGITEEQENEISSLIDDHGIDKAAFLKWCGVETIADIPDYKKARTALEQKIKGMKK